MVGTNIFHAIDTAFLHGGLEGALREISTLTRASGDFTTWQRAESQLARIELGIPENVDSWSDASRHNLSAEWENLRDREDNLHTEAARLHEILGNLEKAAQHYIQAGERKLAAGCLIRESSDESLGKAASILVGEEFPEKDQAPPLDLERGIELMAQTGYFVEAFGVLEDILGRNDGNNGVGYKKIQGLADYLMKALYNATLEHVSEYIEDEYGEIPKKGATLRELIKGKDLSRASFTIENCFHSVAHWARHSPSEDVREMGIHLVEVVEKCDSTGGSPNVDYERVKVFVTGRRTHSEECVRFFLRRAGMGHYSDAEDAVWLLRYTGNPTRALKVAEDFLDIEDDLVLEVTKEADPKGVLRLYERRRDLVGYTLAKFELSRH